MLFDNSYNKTDAHSANINCNISPSVVLSGGPFLTRILDKSIRKIIQYTSIKINKIIIFEIQKKLLCIKIKFSL
jgi:hypothetical protein